MAATSMTGAPAWAPSRRARHLDTVLIVLTAAAMAMLYTLAYRAHPAHPHIGGNPGWWVWFDQERYFKAAQAWAHGNLDPAEHWYLPGYPLLAAPFVRLASVHAFFVTNLACLLASFWLFTRLAARLAPRIPHAAALGGVVFAATTVLSPLGLAIWVVPWSTTGTAPLFYGALLAMANFVLRPQRAGQAFLAALCAGCVIAFRPSDILPLVAAGGLGIGGALLAQRPGWRVALRAAAAAAAGGGTALALAALAYLPLYGMTRSTYVLGAAGIGLDWGLVPLHWVSIVLSPQPLLSDGRGLIEAFPWMAAGFAGMGAFLLLRLRDVPWLVHATVITALVLHAIVYLAFRDLNPDHLFRFGIYHYFKWMYPVLALYGVLLVHALLTMSGRRAALLGTAVATLAVLLPWRTELRVTGEPPSKAEGNRLSFQSGMATVRDALLVPATGEWGAIYFAPSMLQVGGGVFGLGDIKPVPRTGGFVLQPMRTLPTGPAVLTMASGVSIDPALPVFAARQDTVFGLPCWLPAALHTCPPQLFYPPPPLPEGGEMRFDGSEAPFLASGWSVNEGSGRWTDGRVSGLRVRVPPGQRGWRLALSAYAYLPKGSPPLQVEMLVNDHPVFNQAISQVPLLSLAAEITPAMLPAANGKAPEMTLTFRFANPRSPETYDSSSADARRLGLFIRSISLSPLS